MRRYEKSTNDKAKYNLTNDDISIIKGIIQPDQASSHGQHNLITQIRFAQAQLLMTKDEKDYEKLQN